MKALILAAGAGKRLKLLTREQNKCMFPIYGRPLIEHSLDIAASLDEIDEIIIVVGHMAEAIINQYGTRYRGKTIRYRIQSPLKGVVAAVASAKPDIDGHDLLLLFASEIIPSGRYKEMVADFYETRPYVSCGVVQSVDPSQIIRTYTVIQNEKGHVYRLVEKPQRVINEWMGTGSCILTSRVLDYITYVPVHPVTRETTLPDLIQTAVDNGHRVKAFHLGNEYISINTKEDMVLVESGGAGAKIDKSNSGYH